MSNFKLEPAIIIERGNIPYEQRQPRPNIVIEKGHPLYYDEDANSWTKKKKELLNCMRENARILTRFVIVEKYSVFTERLKRIRYNQRLEVQSGDIIKEGEDFKNKKIEKFKSILTKRYNLNLAYTDNNLEINFFINDITPNKNNADIEPEQFDYKNDWLKICELF